MGTGQLRMFNRKGTPINGAGRPLGTGKPIPQRRKLDYELLKVDLLENTKTRIQLGEKYGVSRERIRQLENKLLRRTGREAEEERKKIAREYFEQEMEEDFKQRPIVKKLLEMGMTVEPVIVQNGSYDKIAYKVNGKNCRVKSLFPDHKGYWRLVPSRRTSDVVLFSVPGTNDYLVIPKEKMPRVQTTFKLGDIGRRGGWTFRHDWSTFLNRWDILKNGTDGSTGTTGN